VLSPASGYFDGVLQLVRATDPGAATVAIFYASTGFGRDVATGAASTATQLNFQVQSVPFESGHVLATTSTLPDADILLVVGSFDDELAAAPVLLTRNWKAAAFVGAGVEEVLTPLGSMREGLIGPAQWMPTVPLQPDEGPDAAWFVEKYKQIAGVDPPYPAAQAFAAGILCARCIRESGSSEDSLQLAMALRLVCTTLYGRFRIDPVSGLQVGHQVLIVQWQEGVRRVVWPPELAECPFVYPLKK
jgi:branched-chain amino acid transport system substrate-binding protein